MHQTEWAGPWRRGDIVRRDNSVGIVREVCRRADGKRFLMVQIVQGPLLEAGTRWTSPEAWTPQLDVGDKPTYVSICGECGREFKATRDVEAICRTCDETGLRLRTLRERVGGE